MKDKKRRVSSVPPPPHTVVYKTKGVFERLHLCEYLRELEEERAGGPAGDGPTCGSLSSKPA
jgi:hypothetical protein